MLLTAFALCAATAIAADIDGDIFANSDHSGDEVHCGEGNDTVFADNNDDVANDCELSRGLSAQNLTRRR